MFSLSYSRPCKSRLSEEEYQFYKSGLEDVLTRCMTMDIPIPRIEFNDKYRHILLRNFDGCISDETVTIPDGVTIVYVDELSKGIDNSKKYSIVFSDTVQSVDALPLINISNIDTNCVEYFRLKDSKYNQSLNCIDNVLIRNHLKSDGSIGHLHAMNIYYSISEPYSLKGNQVFIPESNGNIYLTENCKDYKLKYKVRLHLCGCNDVNGNWDWDRKSSELEKKSKTTYIYHKENIESIYLNMSKLE